MIDKIHIRNFLSIKEAEVKLGKVNLLIGPNNSGKSNFLKAFEFLKIYHNLEEKKLIRFIYQHKINDYKTDGELALIGISFNNDQANTYICNNGADEIFVEEQDQSYMNDDGITIFEETINDFIIYQPNISLLKSFSTLNVRDNVINSDASNLVSFLDNMRDEKPEVIRKIEESLQNTIANFQEIRFKKSVTNPNQKIIGLAATNNNVFWADEISEGTLYFLAILSIIHQPNPPKLLLLEEPEKNVHPKRIHEIIDYLFQLSEEKDIQIIMTTHSPIIVDEFMDIPENVHLFDFVDNQTKISNMAEVIEKQNKDRKNKGYNLLDFSKSTLAEHWLMGFLGGVPTE